MVCSFFEIKKFEKQNLFLYNLYCLIIYDFLKRGGGFFWKKNTSTLPLNQTRIHPFLLYCLFLCSRCFGLLLYYIFVNRFSLNFNISIGKRTPLKFDVNVNGHTNTTPKYMQISTNITMFTGYTIEHTCMPHSSVIKCSLWCPSMINQTEKYAQPTNFPLGRIILDSPNRNLPPTELDVFPTKRQTNGVRAIR